MTTDALWTGGLVAVAVGAVRVAELAITMYRRRNGRENRGESQVKAETEMLLTLRRIDVTLTALPGEIRRAIREGMKE